MQKNTSGFQAGKPRAAVASAVAGRLRLLQAELADESPELREQLLAEELQRALNAIVPSDRLEFLANLEAQFPTWDTRVALSTQSSPAVHSDTDRRELQDPSFLVSRLIDSSSTLTADQRQVLIDRLQDAGLSPAAVSPWPAAAIKLLHEQFKLTDSTSINPTRLVELIVMLTQLTISLDQVLRLAWKEIAPRSTLRRPAELHKTLARFVASDEGVPRGQVQQELEALRSLIAALIQAVGHAGKHMAQGYRKYSPGEIESLARIEKKWTESIEETCWRKYKDLAAELQESSVDASVRQMIADYTESYLGHRR